MKNIYLKVLAIFITSLFLKSCGLPSYSVVEPPVRVTPTATYVGFSAPGDDSNISGYEIYYKIYVATETSSISSDENQFDTENANYTYQFGAKKLDNLKFKRLKYGNLITASSTSFSTPIIGVDSLIATSDCLISVGVLNGYISVNSLNIGIPLRIAKTTDGNDYLKAFLKNVVTADIDNNEENPIAAGTPYSVSFAAYSYVSTNSFLDYDSSIPVFLGTITNIANN